MSAGIDYGMGTVNIDQETGIRYGVIPVNDVCQAWSDESEPVYPEPDPDEEEPEDFGPEYDPSLYVYSRQGYVATQSADDTDIFITKSPFYTKAQFCSPCAPGAGHLRNPDPDGVKTYCFGKDWFEDEECPYPYWSVDTNELVYQPVDAPDLSGIAKTEHSIGFKEVADG